ncbi:cation transporter [Arthrobacter psychrolactophilus]|uniref:cation transporter n=1 Tax=Arthrobacter psychrolactophilus TaxID=92442 RepID=UPI0026D1409E|nr:cation transporter [Arthrobacter psychrolactophilus]
MSRSSAGPLPHKPRGSVSVTDILAFSMNVLVAIAKTVAALITGSASMVAESAHSWADTGNQVFLMVAERKSAKPRDTAHGTPHGVRA